MEEMEVIFENVAMSESVAGVSNGCREANVILANVNNAKMTSVRYRMGAKDKFITGEVWNSMGFNYGNMNMNIDEKNFRIYLINS